MRHFTRHFYGLILRVNCMCHVHSLSLHFTCMNNCMTRLFLKFLNVSSSKIEVIQKIADINIFDCVTYQISA